MLDRHFDKSLFLDWKQEGSTIYKLNPQYTNMFSANVQQGFIHQTRQTQERMKHGDTIQIAKLMADAPIMLSLLKEVFDNTKLKEPYRSEINYIISKHS